MDNKDLHNELNEIAPKLNKRTKYSFHKDENYFDSIKGENFTSAKDSKTSFAKIFVPASVLCLAVASTFFFFNSSKELDTKEEITFTDMQEYLIEEDIDSDLLAEYVELDETDYYIEMDENSIEYIDFEIN